jgi:outer membrane protein TolC
MAFLVCLVLVSCQVGVPESRMGEVSGHPGAWTATKQAKAGIDDRWVDRFGDSSLNKLVAEAYAANGDLRAAAARVERAAALARGDGFFLAARNSMRQAMRRGRSGTSSGFRILGRVRRRRSSVMRMGLP